MFQIETLRVGWATTSLQSITSVHPDLRKISLRIPLGRCSDVNERLIEGADLEMRWSDLNRLLVQFWESHPIQVKVVCPSPLNSDGWSVLDWVTLLLPELMKRGIIDLVEVPGCWFFGGFVL